MQILRRLKRGQKDPNPYPVRCKRRRKRSCLSRIMHIVRLIADVLPYYVADDVYYPYGRQVDISATQSRADGLAGLKALTLLSAYVRADRDEVRDYLGMDADTYAWWIRGINCARSALAASVLCGQPDSSVLTASDG